MNWSVIYLKKKCTLITKTVEIDFILDHSLKRLAEIKLKKKKLLKINN